MQQNEIYKSLETMAQKSDPWNKTVTKQYQKKAYQNLLLLIQKVPHASILEVGCAQGDFTRELITLSSDITAIDVSESAIAVAKKNVQGVTFAVSSLEEFEHEKKFDIVICAEVLYYILDLKKALQKLSQLGKYLVTSNFLVCLPMVSLKSLQYEFSLRRFPLVTRIVEHDLRLGLLDIKSLRKLQEFLL